MVQHIYILYAQCVFVCVFALPFYQLKYNIETFIILGTDKVLFDYNMTLQYGICLIDKMDRIHQTTHKGQCGQTIIKRKVQGGGTARK